MPKPLFPDYDAEERRYMDKWLSVIMMLLVAALILLVTTFAALSQTTSSQAGAQSASGAQAGAGAQSGSAAIVQQTFTGPPEQRQTVIYGGGTQSTITQAGGFRQDYRATIRNTPDAYAPNLSGGTNPCTQGASAGGSVAGFGLALGGSWSDPNCERRNLSALLHNQGQHALAQEVLCETETVRQARLRMGQPCSADVPRPAQPNATVISAAPLPTPPVEVVSGGANQRSARQSVPDWCATATAAERRQYRTACGG